MFGKNFVRQLIDRSAENPEDRLRFLKSASAAGLGVVGVLLAVVHIIERRGATT